MALEKKYKKSLDLLSNYPNEKIYIEDERESKVCVENFKGNSIQKEKKNIFHRLVSLSPNPSEKNCGSENFIPLLKEKKDEFKSNDLSKPTVKTSPCNIVRNVNDVKKSKKLKKLMKKINAKKINESSELQYEANENSKNQVNKSEKNEISMPQSIVNLQNALNHLFSLKTRSESILEEKINEVVKCLEQKQQILNDLSFHFWNVPGLQGLMVNSEPQNDSILTNPKNLSKNVSENSTKSGPTRIDNDTQGIEPETHAKKFEELRIQRIKDWAEGKFDPPMSYLSGLVNHFALVDTRKLSPLFELTGEKGRKAYFQHRFYKLSFSTKAIENSSIVEECQECWLRQDLTVNQIFEDIIEKFIIHPYELKQIRQRLFKSGINVFIGATWPFKIINLYFSDACPKWAIDLADTYFPGLNISLRNGGRKINVIQEDYKKIGSALNYYRRDNLCK